MIIDPEKTSTKDLYKLLIGSVVPRPIAWISSLSKDGVANLAPFSFFNAFSVDPPILGIGIGAKRIEREGKSISVAKDTFLNIRETEEFVVNIVGKKLAEKMNQTSANYDRKTDEFEACGLTPEPSTKVKPARVKESPIAFECRLYKIVELGKSNLVLGKVLGIRIEDSVLKKGLVDIDELAPVGRLGGISYCQIDNQTVFEIERPKDPE